MSLPPINEPRLIDDPLLQIRGLSVEFDGFHALTDVDLDARQGEVHFLIGPNGAGKTTIVDIVTGLTKPTSGVVKFDGDDLLGRSESTIVKMGISRSFQTATVFNQLSVLENLDLAASFRLSTLKMLRRRRGIEPAVQEALERTGLDAVRDRPAGELAHGQKQWLEIGMLLVQEPRMIFLDEPVAGMSPDERTRTGELVREAARNCTVVVVEHDMDFVRRFANRVTVLHEGKVLMHGATVAEVQADPVVQEVYIGRARDARTGGEVEATA